MKKLILCTGRPASGKTTLLKELARQRHTYARYRYVDLDAKDCKNLGYYCGKTYVIYCVDKLLMTTVELYNFLKEAVVLEFDEITIYKFADDVDQCLVNNSERKPERSAHHTIKHKEYQIDADCILSAFPETNIKFVELPVYEKSEWEQYFEDRNINLSYKVVAYDYNGEQWDVNPKKVNKRYITSDYWATDKRTKHYDDEYTNDFWTSEYDDQPVEFKEIEDLLSSIPNLTYDAGRQLRLNLVNKVSYEVSDYYSTATHTYYYVDAEALYNQLKLFDKD